MAERGLPNNRELLEVMRHLADVVALKAEPVAQRQVLIDGLNRLVGIDQSWFYIGEDWRGGPGRQPRFSHRTLSRDLDSASLKYGTELGVKYPMQVDPFCEVARNDPRTFQTWTTAQVLRARAGSEQQHEPFIDCYRTVRLQDGVVCMFRTGATGDRVIGVGMHRPIGARRVTARQVRIVEFAVAEVRRLVECGHLALPADPASSGLGARGMPPRLAQVLELLLAGESPKGIARRVGLSVWTVREHVQRLYRRFGVNGRDELMARFVAEPPPPRTPPPA